MAIQTTPHTSPKANADLDDTEISPGQETAQTGGTRAFNANNTQTTGESTPRDGGETSGNTTENLPKDGATGITTHSAGEERERQEKVITR